MLSLNPEFILYPDKEIVIVPFVFVFVFLAAEVLLISAATLFGTLNFFTSISNFITLGNPLEI
jgi:hypothetical protein